MKLVRFEIFLPLDRFRCFLARFEPSIARLRLAIARFEPAIARFERIPARFLPSEDEYAFSSGRGQDHHLMESMLYLLNKGRVQRGLIECEKRLSIRDTIDFYSKLDQFSRFLDRLSPLLDRYSPI
ncbi:hypothetical protein WMZ97_14260 [Lentibacillus sp. N15]